MREQPVAITGVMEFVTPTVSFWQRPGSWQGQGLWQREAAPVSPPAAPRVLLVDNYDSFTYNLVQSLLVLGCDVDVIINDASAEVVDRLLAKTFAALIISPGPGAPSQPCKGEVAAEAVSPAGVGGTGGSQRFIEEFRRRRAPVLGVCLGHQLLASLLGAQLRRRSTPVHGKQSFVAHTDDAIFAGLPQPMPVARYHSLEIDPQTVADPLRVIATVQGSEEIMAVGVVGEMTWGVQFHPESFMTPQGDALLANFLRGALCEGAAARDKPRCAARRTASRTASSNNSNR